MPVVPGSANLRATRRHICRGLDLRVYVRARKHTRWIPPARGSKAGARVRALDQKRVFR